MSSQLPQPLAVQQVRDVLTEVVSRYVSELKPTPRKVILLKLKGLPDMLEELKRCHLLTARTVTSHEDFFLPTFRTFQELADPEILANAKRATGEVLNALQHLFETSDKQIFTAEEVKKLVRERTGGALSSREIDIGLYLSTEFHYLGSYSPLPDGTTLSHIGPQERIIHFVSIEEEWNQRLALYDRSSPVQSLDIDWSRRPSNDYFVSVLGSSQDEDADDRRFALMAIEEARKSIPEDGRPHPRVGAVVVKNGVVLSRAYRGEAPQCHAEYIALEKKLQDESVAGATVYTTLEPCTTRNHPKIPCAQRLVDRKVSRVVIGMLDPNPQIRGLGDQLLSDANIEVQMFPRELRAQVEEMNRDFIREQRRKQDQQQERVTTAQPPLEPNMPDLVSNSKKEAIVTIRSRDWDNLATKFDEFVPSYVRAEWYSETLDWEGNLVPEQWMIRDDWNNQFAPRCQALCQIAGAMLLKSPHIAERLPQKVKATSDDAWRWLYFLSEKRGTLKITCEGETSIGGIKHKNKGATISDLPAVSSTTCLECAAEEI